MATNKIPTEKELINFVEENELNVFEEPVFDGGNQVDIDTVTIPVLTFIEEEYVSLVEKWQALQPCELTPSQIYTIYNKALAKLATAKDIKTYFYYVDVCQRILDYKLNKIYRLYGH